MANGDYEKPRNEKESLLDLQRFLSEEATETVEDVDFSRAFVPLTDGLGIQSPVRATPPVTAAPVATPPPVPAARPAAPPPRTEIFDTDPVVRSAVASPEKPRVTTNPRLAAALGDSPAPTTAKPTPPSAKVVAKPVSKPVLKAPPPAPTLEVEEEEEVEMAFLAEDESAPVEDLPPTEELAADRSIAESHRQNLAVPPNTWGGASVLLSHEDPRLQEMEAIEPRPAVLPPPVPTVSLSRRLFATSLDQLFALTLWAIALGITSYLMGQVGEGRPMTFDTLAEDFQSRAFWRFAVLEYATLWLAHLALGLGVLDRTFGMWVWGIKVKYLGRDSDSRFLRKVSRIVFAFLFFAPLAPALLLLPRRHGRNLLDWLSGTALYRTLE